MWRSAWARPQCATYAAPAFWQSADLFAHASAGTIVANSNIASVCLLTGHERLTYAAPGHFGIAHSEPAEIESSSLGAILREAGANDRLPFTRQMKSAAEQIQRGLEGDRDCFEIWRAAREAILGGDGAERFPRAEGSWFDAIISIAAFSQAFDIRMTAVG